MYQGTIKFFNTSKGFGFIANDDGGDDVFVHITALKDRGEQTTLSEGQKVTFDIERDSRNGKLRAANVSIVS